MVSFDADNDVAILRVPGLQGTPLGMADPERGEPAALLGFPGNGPFRATPVRMGRAAKVGLRDAYGRFELGRTVVALRGNVERRKLGRPGRRTARAGSSRRSSGPAQGSDDGYAVPNGQVANALANVGPPLETACVAR